MFSYALACVLHSEPIAKLAFGYVVTDYQAMRDLFLLEDRMRTGFAALVELMGAEGTPWAGERDRRRVGPRVRRVRPDDLPG